MTLRPITQVKNLTGKRVLLRLDLNVPLNKNGGVANDFRIKKSLDTIRYLKKQKAKVIIISHIGRNGSVSLKRVAQHINKYTRVGFAPDCIGGKVCELCMQMRNGSAIMLENLRAYRGEMANEKSFAEDLAQLADVYVNDAFAVSHRKNASIVQLPRVLPSYIGLRFAEEIEKLSSALMPPKSSLLILGGAKIHTKMPLLNKYLGMVGNIFVGGALANTLLKERGFEVGKSVVDSGLRGLKKIARHKKVILPSDFVVLGGIHRAVKPCFNIGKKDVIMDIGPESNKKLASLIATCDMVIMNGPLGNYEKGFDASMIAMLTAMKKTCAQTIVGGGDTALLVSQLRMEKKLTFVSTGGGAMLDFLAHGTLVGIEALRNKR